MNVNPSNDITHSVSQSSSGFTSNNQLQVPLKSSKPRVNLSTSDFSASDSSSNSITSFKSLHDISKRTELYQGLISLDTQVKLVVIMVGLPARGKSYIVKKLKRYLSWLSLNVKIFNVGDRRRKLPIFHMSTPSPTDSSSSHTQSAISDHDDLTIHTSGFFDPKNLDASKKREGVAMEALDEIIEWIDSGGQVAIHDATNSTIRRRKNILNKLKSIPGLEVLFIESICNDPDIIEANILLKLKSPDYVHVDPIAAQKDFRERLANYETSYEPLGQFEEENFVQYFKIIDVGRKITTFNINGFLEGQCVFYLMNMNLEPRLIYITRHGESYDNVLGRIGGDASLTESGEKFSLSLSKFVEKHQAQFEKNITDNKKSSLPNMSLPNPDFTPSKTLFPSPSPQGCKLEIWTSMLKRAIQTVQYFDHSKFKFKKFSVLNELYSGLCEGMTYQDIPKVYPREFSDRSQDKLFTRYPGMHGESYVDVIHRLQYIIVELERIRNSVLIVTHRAVARTLLAYFLDINIEDMPYLNIPINYVFICEPKHFGNDLSLYKWIESTDEFVKVDSKILHSDL
ncbi:putative 6-phosphofructo-2-kinase [Smittium mucronatum]|uniref:Putative 6-phosphofructo-2-kinase n=1 Tax=Smittium mucronatum TaxID=133383 RepID=A0A1R0H917_9FUNG|nr:putative 6-phosphofructo-2-kinase [Smittium mucronatum]